MFDGAHIVSDLQEALVCFSDFCFMKILCNLHYYFIFPYLSVKVYVKYICMQIDSKLKGKGLNGDRAKNWNHSRPNMFLHTT